MSANSNSIAKNWKYNGKELDESLGLNMYDYGARFYDPSLGRWFTPDALAEKYYNQSTYTYTLNNPILFVDPDGNQVEMCCKELLSTLRRWQSSGSAMTTATSQAADNFTQPARNATQRASNVVTQVSQASSEMRSSAINSHVATSKALYGIQAQMGGSGVGFTSGLRSAVGSVATKEGSVLQELLQVGDNASDLVTVVGKEGDDVVRYLNSIGAEAVFVMENGGVGSMWMREGAAIETVAEELIHYQQFKTHGETYMKANRTLLEIDAQDQLLGIGKTEGWSTDVMDRIKSAKKSWQKLLNDETKRAAGN